MERYYRLKTKDGIVSSFKHLDEFRPKIETAEKAERQFMTMELVTMDVCKKRTYELTKVSVVEIYEYEEK